MRDTYPDNDIWAGFGVIYAVLCVSAQRKPFWAIVNPAPNLDGEVVIQSEDGKPIASTPSDASLFGRPRNSAAITKPEQMMRHLVGEILMQFLMGKSLGSRSFTTGMFGCGMFGGDPEFYAEYHSATA